jgi:hypothetical protein
MSTQIKTDVMDKTYIYTKTRNAFNILDRKPHWGPQNGQEENILMDIRDEERAESGLNWLRVESSDRIL